VSAAPDISLPRFEGPLDLLLALVRKNEVEITGIPIAEITRQYLDYLHQAQEFNIDLGADFIYFAALLIHIKSRSLLPADPEIARREPDPRETLVRQLLDHEQLLHGAEFLKQKLEIAEATWSRPSIREFPPLPRHEFPEPDATLNLLQILRLAQQALATARTYDLVTPDDPVSVEQMMGWLELRLARTADCLEATALLEEQPDTPHRNALFLAMLEMAKSAQIRMEQSVSFGPIIITKVDMAQPCPDID
jgi:segregation and condensation protein A